MLQDKYESVDFSESPLIDFSSNDELNFGLRIQGEHDRDAKMMNLNQISNFLSYAPQNQDTLKADNYNVSSENNLMNDCDQIKVCFEEEQQENYEYDNSSFCSYEVLPLWLDREFSSVKFLTKNRKNTEQGNCLEEKLKQNNNVSPSDNGLFTYPDMQEEVFGDSELTHKTPINSKIWGWKTTAVHSSEYVTNCTPIGILDHECEDCSESGEHNSTTVVNSIERSEKTSEIDSDTQRSENSLYKPTFAQVVDGTLDVQTNLNKRDQKQKTKEHENSNTSPLRKRRCKKEVATLSKNIRKRTKLLSSGESSSKDIIDLATRRDVVNKTILRVLRRYLTQKLKECTPVETDGKQNKREKFFMNVKNLATEMFGKNHANFKILHFYIASIIDYKYLTVQDVESSGVESEELTTFYDCLYKYSHTRLVNLFSVQPLGEIYNYFYNEAKDRILDSETSLSKNKSLYKKVMKEFEQIFLGKIDINTLII